MFSPSNAPLRREGTRRALLALAVFSLIGAGKAAPARSPAPASVALKGVPYVAQLPNYCGPAALSGLFSFWGKSISQSAIGQEVYDRRLSATNGADLLLFAREEGFAAYSYLTSLQGLKSQLRAGFPVIVLQQMSAKDTRGHFRVVTGYNDLSRRFLVRDSNYEEVRSMPYDEFDLNWSPFGRWALIVCPKERERGLAAAIRENPVLHLDLGQAYLRRRNDQLARLHFQETLRLEPRNEEALDQLATMGAGSTVEED
jgi:hypothetical protein